MTGVLGGIGTITRSDIARMHACLRHRGEYAHVQTAAIDEPVIAVLSSSSERTTSIISSRFVIGGAYRDLAGGHLGGLVGLTQKIEQSGLAAALEDSDAEFAIAVFDRTNQTLYLCRDRVGTQPLYYCRVTGGIAFASEYKSLVALPGFDRTLDLGALRILIDNKSVPVESTLFESVRQVPPGGYVEIRGSDIRVERYWTPELRVDSSASLNVRADQLTDLLVESVSKRVRGQRRIAVALSGGVDSMVVLAAASRSGAGTVETYSIGDSPDDPEIHWARRVAEHFGTDHHETVLDPDSSLFSLSSLVWALEDPIARSETLLTFELARFAAGDSRNLLMLRGDGADGLFGGMPRHKLLALGGRFPMLARDLWQVYEYTQSGRAPTRILARLAARYGLKQSIPARPLVNGLNENSASSGAAAAVPVLDRELLNRVLILGPRQALPVLLQKAERPSAYHGVYPSTPFVDPGLMSFAHALPSRFKNDGRGNKIMLRLSAEKLLPKEFAQRPKYAQRVREEGAFCRALESTAKSWKLTEALEDRGQLHLDSGTRELLSGSREGRYQPEEAMLLWTLLLCEIWCRTFIDQPAPEGAVSP